MTPATFALTLWSALAAQPCEAPPLTDLDRLPSQPIALVAWRAASDYERCANLRAVTYPRHGDYWRAAAGEAAWLARAWDHLYYAHVASDYSEYGANGNDACRRQHLADLREMIGDAAYYAGRMPPLAPVWRSWEIE